MYTVLQLINNCINQRVFNFFNVSAAAVFSEQFLAHAWALGRSAELPAGLPDRPEGQVQHTEPDHSHRVYALEDQQSPGQTEWPEGRRETAFTEESPGAPHRLSSRVHGPPAGDLSAELTEKTTAAGACGLPAGLLLLQRGERKSSPADWHLYCMF